MTRTRTPQRPLHPPRSSATGNYGDAFQADIQDGSLLSARKIVPTLIDLVQPDSVLDVGCGTGAWLAAFRDQGITDVIGVDGDYVGRDLLLIPPDRFQARDIGRPFSLGRRFGLVLSLEVGEHLPASTADRFVETLTRHADVVAFSAAIPNQGGEGHVNERWPSYWTALFARRRFVLVNCLRHRFWNDRDIEKWYRQNLLLFVAAERLERDQRLLAEKEANRNQILSVVHPDTFFPLSLRQLIRSFPGSLRRALRRRL